MTTSWRGDSLTPEDSANPKQKLAEARTDLADDRTVLAHERTYAAWLRTGIAALAIGLGLERLLDDLEPRWLVSVVSLAIILIALIMFFISMWRYRQLRFVNKDGPSRATPKWVVIVMSVLAIVAAAAAFYLAWKARFGAVLAAVFGS